MRVGPSWIKIKNLQRSKLRNVQLRETQMASYILDLLRSHIGEPVVVVDVVQEQTDEGVQEPTVVDEEPIE